MARSKIISKFWHFSVNQLKMVSNYIHVQQRKRSTKNLRKQGNSDLKRWKDSKELDESWNERTYIMASMVSPNSRVIEFGAGNMKLRDKIPHDCSYQASDIIARFPGVIECDLNEKISIDLKQYNTAVFSGVLEYVYNIENVLSQLAPYIENIVLSYASRDISNAPRLERGWLSDYSKEELERIFASCGYEVSEYKEWRNQSIFSLKRNKKIN